MERRHFLQWIGAAGLVGLAGGCGDPVALQASPENGMDDSICLDDIVRNIQTRKQQPRVIQRQPAPRIVQPVAGDLSMVPRSAWNAGKPIASRLKAMTRIRRVTVHHEGCPRANWNSSTASVAQDLRRIQVAHRKRMRAGDIGYHYIVDRQGRIWEGRSLRYQGAHVRNNNEGNIGIMCLGNFDIQKPSLKQLTSLERLVQTVCGHYRLNPLTIYGHSDLVATRCPGRYLKGQVHGLRGVLARA